VCPRIVQGTGFISGVQLQPATPAKESTDVKDKRQENKEGKNEKITVEYQSIVRHFVALQLNSSYNIVLTDSPSDLGHLFAVTLEDPRSLRPSGKSKFP
jgi:hypothetical protein